MIDMAALDLLLIQYAAGTLGPCESFMVAVHLAMNPSARQRLARYEAEGGKMIEDSNPAHISSACLDGIMQAITQKAAARDASPRPQSCGETSQLAGVPDRIYALLKSNCAGNVSCWHRARTGVEIVNISVCKNERKSTKLRLIRMAPRQKTPAHRHIGRELTLVLEGGYSDHTGHYTTGDIVIVSDPAFAHSPVADTSGCTVLQMIEAPQRFQGPLVQFLQFFRQI